MPESICGVLKFDQNQIADFSTCADLSEIDLLAKATTYETT
jgi:hypothetical protein